MNPRKLVAAALLSVILAPGLLPAQSIDSPYRFVETRHGILAFGSYVFTDRGVLGAGPASGEAFGVGYGLRISGPFGLDTRITYFPTTREVLDTIPADSATLRDDPSQGISRLGPADVSLLLVDASLRFDLTGPRTFYGIQPYALIGGGGVFRVASDDAAEEALPEESELRIRFRNGFTGHVGAGFDWYPGRRWTVRLDARDVLWRIHLPDPFLAQGRVIDQAEWVQNAHLSLGISFRF